MDYLNNMASIYAHATVTIIAAQGGDADSGLRGVARYGSKPQRTHQDVFSVGSEKVVNRIFDFRYTRKWKLENWYSRGWTYQEDLFSGRRLVFEIDSVRWECFRCALVEDMLTDQWGRGKRDQSLFTPFSPNVSKYQEIALKYHGRQLTYGGDTLFALAGVTTALSQTFQGGFLCGLAELFFDHAILWTLQGTPKRNKLPLSTRGIPTWSWSGWFMTQENHDWGSACVY